MNEDTFVERMFENQGQAVVCRFHKPTLEPGGEHKCRWSVDWGPERKRGFSCGIDGIQALLLAMRTVHTDLIHSEAYAAGQLTWLDGPDLALPPAWTFDEDASPDA